MRGLSRPRYAGKTSKLIAAALVGSAFGAAISFLMNPAQVARLRRRLKGRTMGVASAYERVRTLAGQGSSGAGEVPYRRPPA